jgi:hypothetical protein
MLILPNQFSKGTNSAWGSPVPWADNFLYNNPILIFRSIVCYWIIFECIRWQLKTIGGKPRERDVKNQLMYGSWESTDN